MCTFMSFTSSLHAKTIILHFIYILQAGLLVLVELLLVLIHSIYINIGKFSSL
jgi:hypothetical protein